MKNIDISKVLFYIFLIFAALTFAGRLIIVFTTKNLAKSWQLYLAIGLLVICGLFLSFAGAVKPRRNKK